VRFQNVAHLVLFVFSGCFFIQHLVCYSYISKKLKNLKKGVAKLTSMVYNVIKVVESGEKRMKGGRKLCFLVNISIR